MKLKKEINSYKLTLIDKIKFSKLRYKTNKLFKYQIYNNIMININLI